MKTQVVSDKSPAAIGPFSQAVIVDRLVFTSGQIYLNTEGKLIEGSVEDKTKQIMSNLQNILQSAGTTFAQVVKTTIYVTDLSIYGKINEVYGTYFTGTIFPARELVCVKALPLGAEIEISMVAEIL